MHWFSVCAITLVLLVACSSSELPTATAGRILAPNPTPVKAGITVLAEPAEGYIDFMNVLTGACLVITDSGGLQEETTFIGIPCLTMRENTERPVTVTQGTNKLVTATDLPEQVLKILGGHWKTGCCPPFWDGNTAIRAV